MQEPSRARAVMMAASGSTVSLLGEGEGTRDQAMLMRNDRAEWVRYFCLPLSRRRDEKLIFLLPPDEKAATQQHLYSSPSLRSSLTAGPSLGGSPNPSSRRSSISGGSSDHSPSSRFNMSRDDVLYFNEHHSPEDDDDLHDVGDLKLESYGPDHRLLEPKSFTKGGSVLGMDWRGALNLFAVVLILLALVFAFAGMPIIAYVKEINSKPYGADGLSITGSKTVTGGGGTPKIPAYRGLIDKDTPESAKTMRSFLEPGKNLQLVFSDEVRPHFASFAFVRRC
jgi:hypothetical protein